MKKIQLLLLLLVSSVLVNAQVTGTKTIPGDYATLAAAITDLNTVGVGAGGATINLTQVETAPTGGYLLGSAVLNASTSATNTLTINGGNNVITAWANGINTLSDAVFIVAGTDYLTLNQLNIVENAANTTTTTQMERGIALMAFSSTDACQYVTVQNCTVNLNGTTQIGTTETGIYVSQQLYTAAATFVTNSTTPTSAAGVADNIKIRANTVQNCYTGIAATASTSTLYYATNIQIGGTTPADGNTITGFASTTSGTTTQGNGIYTYYVGGAYISNNSITGTLVYSSTTYGIYSYYTSAASTVSNNTVTITTPSASTNTVYAIYHYYATSVCTGSRCDSNTVQNCVAGGTNTFYNIYHYVPVTLAGASPYLYTRNNTVNNFTRNGLSGITYGIYSYSSVSSGTIPDRKYLNNTVSNVNMPSMGGSGTLYGLYFITYHGGLVKGNKITNVSINNGASTTSQTFYNLYLYNYSGAALNLTVDSNEVSNFSYTGAAATMYNSYIYSSSTANSFYFTRNKITNNGITGGATSANVEGTYVSTVSGPIYYMNNEISNLYATAGAVDQSIKGIDWTGGTAATNFIYNNTINLGGTALLTSTGTNFGVTGIGFTAAVNIKNNIIRVNATANGTGYADALRGVFTGTAGTISANFAAGSGNNILYVPSAANAYLYAEHNLNTAPLVGYNLTNDPNFNTACGVWKGLAGTRGTATFTENNLTALSTGVYVPSGTSYAESNAATLAQVTNDYLGAVRPALPDCGAIEFAGTALDASGPTISYTNIPNTPYCSTLPTLSATITDLSGINTTVGTKPRLYYKKSTEADALVGNTSVDNGWKYVEASNAVSPFTFSINPALLTSAPVLGDIIQYFVVAQDNVGTPNVGSYSVAYAAGYCPASVALTAGAFPTSASPAIKSFTILSPNVTMSTSLNPTTVCNPGSTVLTVVDTVTSPGVFPTGYLGPYVTGAADDEIWRVQVVGTTLNNTSDCATTGGLAANGLPGSTLKQYSNYTATVAPITLTNGTTYTVNMDLSNCGTFAYSMGISVWIDLNRNGVLETATERVYGSTGTTLGGLYTTAPGYTSTSFTFTIPTTGVVNGPTLMRVFAMESNNGNTHTPASSTLYGEVEDYWVNLNTPNATVVNSMPTSAFTWTATPTCTFATNPNKVVTASGITAATIFTVTATDAGGCTYTSTTSVAMATPVVATGVTGTTTYCSATPNTSLTLTTSNGSTPINSSWSGGPVVTPTTPTCYTQTGFAGSYAPANWTTTQTNSNGTVNAAGAPANIVMTSSNNNSSSAGTTDYSIVATCAGTVSFNWNYTTVDGAPYDYPRYRINAGTPLTFSGYSTVGSATQSGTQNITVAAGDVIGLQAYSTDNGFGSCTITISNFSAPYNLNVVTGTTAVVNPPVGTTTYTVTAVDACGTTSTTTVSVTVNPTPTVVLSPGSVSLCDGLSQVEVASGSGAAPVYTWMPGTLTGATQTLSPTATTVYTVTSTDGPCSATAAFTITKIPQPVFSSTTATPSVLCPNELTALATAATLTVGATGPQAYTVASIPYTPVTPAGPTGTGPSGDDVMSPAVSIGFPFVFYGNTYNNLYISTNGFISFNNVSSGCCSGQLIPNTTTPNDLIALGWEDLTAGAGQITYYNLTSPNRFVIQYTNVAHLSGTGTPLTGQIILYANGIIETHVTNYVHDGTVTTLGVENSGGTLGTAPAGFNSTTWSATNTSFQFSQFVTTPVTNYAWTPAAAGVIASPTTQNTSANPPVALTYTVTATASNGCTNTSTVAVTMKPSVTGTALATPDTICADQSAVLSGTIPPVCGAIIPDFAGDNAPATWANVNTNSNGTVNTASAPASIAITSGSNASGLAGYTDYSKTFACGGTVSFNWSCVNTDYAFMDYPTYQINGGTPTVLTGFNIGSPAATGTQTGTQTITLAAGDVLHLQAYTADNDGLACTLTISNFSAPAAPIAGTVDFWDALTAGTNLGASALTVTPATTTKYYVQYNSSSSLACTNQFRDSVTVTVNPLPIVTASVSLNDTICMGASATFTGGGAATYAWSDGTNTPTDATAFTPTATGTSTYTVTGTDANGCINTATQLFTVNALPVVTASVSLNDTICMGASATFTGGGAATYAWSDGTNTPTDASAFTPTAAGTSTYTVTGTDANGCINTATQLFTVNALPVVTASVSATPICLGNSTTFTGGGATTYTWTDGTNTPTDATAFTPTAAGTSTYTVTGTDANMCSAMSTVSLTVNAVASFNASTTLTSTCPGVIGGSTVVSSTGGTPTITYTASPAGTSQPSSGIFTQMLGGTTYTITLSDANSCTAATTITATNPSAGGLANAPATNSSSTAGNTCQTQAQPDGAALSYYGATCDDIIATVADANGGNTLGNVNACVTVLPSVQTYNGQPYVARTYDITPQNQGPATITLYYTQADFDNYNAAAGSFPTIPADPLVGTVSFCISQVPQGFLPGAPGAATTVHPVTATWNAAANRWEVTFTVTSFSGFYCHACNPLNTPLPASIADFKGRKTEATDLLTWTTTSEMNNSHFNILYSTDAKNYKNIGKVNSQSATGYSSKELSYSFENVKPQLGHNYYKLEQVDIDGNKTINTKVIDLVWGTDASTVNIYPNPTNDELNIDLYVTKAQNTTIKVMDMSGRTVKEVQSKSDVGTNSFKLNLGELASGIYTVQVLENDKLTNVTKVKKN